MAMLTQQQAALLNFIENYEALHRLAPSFVEMQDHLGLASKSGIHRMIEGLAERGYIRRLRGRQRAIEIIRKPGDGLSSREALAKASDAALERLRTDLDVELYARRRDRALAVEIR